MQPFLPQEYLQIIDQHVKKATTKLALIETVKMDPLWKYFQQCEEKLLAFKSDSDEAVGDSEYGLTLYALNHLVLPSNTVFFKSLRMPDSLITPSMWLTQPGATFYEVEKSSGWLGKDGTLFLNIPFGQFDSSWAMSGIFYTLKKLGLIKTHPFITNPATVNITGKTNLKIAIIGDWGTGVWRDGNYPPPAKLISDAIKSLTPQPDIVIHLGDVYYSGLDSEEQRNFLSGFPVCSEFNFTLNSNHEAYFGSQGYYKTALANNIFQKQQGTSFFSITFNNWVILGLDSAYFDKSFLFKKGALSFKNTIQQNFIKSLNIGEDKKVLLLTHHNAMDYTGTTINQPLVGQVYNALGNFYPDYWYYGHLHNGVVYNQKTIIGEAQFKTRNNNHPKLRCVGHSAIPYGFADGLNNNPGVDYFSKTPIDNPDNMQRLRVLNGFAVITLSPNDITEAFYEVSPVTGVSKKWTA